MLLLFDKLYHRAYSYDYNVNENYISLVSVEIEVNGDTRKHFFVNTVGA